MRIHILVALLICFFAAQSQDSLQVARLKSLQGKIKPFAEFAKKDSLFLICFWSVSSEESIEELNSINANMEKWQKTKPFRFLAVSVDEGKLSNRMRGIYNMNGWTFELYADVYGDMRRALHSNNFPQSMILYKNRIIYQQSGWTTGAESYLFQRIVTLKE